MSVCKNVVPRIPHMLHGGDYNPDQWLDRPDVLAEDLRLMKAAGCNVVSLGIFAWTALEPQEGVYRFEWLEDVMTRLFENGVYTILATPSGARPAWMAQQYPEVLRCGPDGRRAAYGSRHNHCPSSPVYREKTTAINRRLAERFGRHPGLALWHVSNEYSGECFCPLCIAAFQQWLQERYGTLEVLNSKWWTAFWSHTYTDWSQIVPPDKCVNALSLNWKRWVTHQTVDFMQNEILPLREITPEIPVTTNLMGTFPGLDYHKFVPVCDVMSWDAYPAYHDRPEDVPLAVQFSFTHDIFRAFKQGKPWLLMESSPSATNWMPVGQLKRPGVHRLTSLQALAHGADSVQYFQWRAGRGAHEKFHGAVVTHDGSGHTRVFRDVAELGQTLGQLDALVGTSIKPAVAVIYDWENRWAIDESSGPRRERKDYLETCVSHYLPFWQRGIPVDVVSMDADISNYSLVIAPMLYMVKPGVTQRLEEFVKNGGNLVATYWSGIVDEDDCCYLGGRPGPLRKLLGIWSEEIDVLYDDEAVPVKFGAILGKEYHGRIFCDLIHAEAAQVLGEYTGEFYAGRPALTVNRFGAGRAFYQAFRGDDAFLDEFYGALAAELKISGPLGTSRLPAGVTLQYRGDAKHNYVFALNFSAEECSVPLDGINLQDVESGECVSGELLLTGHGSRILQVVG